MYYKSTNNVSPWIPDLCAESKWMESERLWILMHAGPFKAAVCGVYLKVNAPSNQEQNKRLLDQIAKEMHELEGLGYMVAIMGHFKRTSKNPMLLDLRIIRIHRISTENF